MTVDASAVASVLGITSQFQDLRDGVAALLPQQIYVIGQGNTGSTYSTAKKRALNAGAIGKAYGYGSQLHNTLRMLLPENGDGVGSIPVTVLPCVDAVSSVAATGDLTFSGSTISSTEEYAIRIGGIQSRTFAIEKGTLDVSTALGRAYAAITAVKEMPVDVVPTYGTVTTTAGAGNAGDGTMGSVTISGGTPQPGPWKLTIVEEAADAGTFKLTDPNGVDRLPLGTVGSAYAANGLSFTLADGSADFEVGDSFEIKVVATDLAFTAKAKGAWTNDIKIVPVLPATDAGVGVSVTAMSGGAVNPDISATLNLIGTDWGTMVLNCANIEDTTRLDVIQTWGEGRWGTLVHMPAVFFTGNTYADFAAATAVSSTRSDDRVNGQLVAPGSDAMPFLAAARQLARIAKQANNDPAVDYVGAVVDGIEPGSDAEQWDYPTRDAAIKAGSSTVEVRNGVIYIGDVCTFYNPEEEQPAAYQFVVNIVRTQNVIYNLWLEFVKPGWAGAPLIPDDEPTNNRNARKPKTAKSAVGKIIDGLADAAIITRRDFAKQSIAANINGPRRLDISFVTPYSGNTNIKDVVHNWGFIFN